MANLYDGRIQWVPSDIVIPNDKMDFIVRLGIKAFAENCFLPCAHEDEPFEQWQELAIRYADLPDDWNRDQYRKMVTPLLPELYKEAQERDQLMREVLESWKEEEDAE